MASLIQRPNSSLYYIQHMVSGKPKRFSTGTDSLKIAEERGRFVHARGTVLISADEAKRRIAKLVAAEPLTIKWAGLDVPESLSQGNMVVAGAIGSGKTRMFRELLKSILPGIKPGTDLRAIIYDVKSDLLSELQQMGTSCDVHVFNPFDTRSIAWDVAADVTNPNSSRHFARALILDHPNDTQFFITATRNVVAGVINVLNEKSPGKWTLRDLFRLTATKERIMKVLAGSDLLEQYKNPVDTFDNVRQTIANAMIGLESVAALWEKVPPDKRVSLKNWVRCENSILVFGGKEDLQESLEPLNRVALKMIAQEFMSGAESPQHSRMWFFCDELKTAGRLDALPIMLNGRSKGVRCALGFQDLEGLILAYGSKDQALEVLNRCASLTCLRLISRDTADWASERTGDVERWEYTDTQTKDGTNVGESLTKREAVLASEFLNLREFDGKAEGFHLLRKVGGVFKASPTYSIPLTDKAQDFLPRKDAEQILAPWTGADAQRLGLIILDEDKQPVVIDDQEPTLNEIGRVRFA